MADVKLVGPGKQGKRLNGWSDFRHFEQCFGRFKYVRARGPEWNLYDHATVRYWNGEIQPFVLLFVDRQSGNYCFGVVDDVTEVELIKIRQELIAAKRLQLLDRRLQCHIVSLSAHRVYDAGYAYLAMLLADSERPDFSGVLHASASTSERSPSGLMSVSNTDKSRDSRLSEFLRYFNRSANALPHKLNECVTEAEILQLPNFLNQLFQRNLPK